MLRRSHLIAPIVIAMGMAWLIAWSAARVLPVQRELDHADSIIVLAGSGTYKERTLHAAQLLKMGRAPLIVLTDDHQRGGWSEEKQENPFFFELASERLLSLGVTQNQIEIVSPAGSGTYQEALAVREFANKHKLNSLLIVTSAYHSRRALWTFQRVFSGTGIEVGLDSVETGQQAPRPGVWWLYLRGWQMVPGEYIKIIYYWLRY